MKAIGKEGGLTFRHSGEGDVDLVENDGISTIPPKYPPMSDTTVDWSVIYRSENAKWAEKGKRSRGGRRDGSTLGRGCEENATPGGGGETEYPEAKTGFRLRKGRYSLKKKRRRGGVNRKRKMDPCRMQRSR